MPALVHFDSETPATLAAKHFSKASLRFDSVAAGEAEYLRGMPISDPFSTEPVTPEAEQQGVPMKSGDLHASSTQFLLGRNSSCSSSSSAGSSSNGGSGHQHSLQPPEAGGLPLQLLQHIQRMYTSISAASDSASSHAWCTTNFTMFMPHRSGSVVPVRVNFEFVRSTSALSSAFTALRIRPQVLPLLGGPCGHLGPLGRHSFAHQLMSASACSPVAEPMQMAHLAPQSSLPAWLTAIVHHQEPAGTDCGGYQLLAAALKRRRMEQGTIADALSALTAGFAASASTHLHSLLPAANSTGSSSCQSEQRGSHAPDSRKRSRDQEQEA